MTSQTLYRWLSDSIPYPSPTMTSHTLFRWLSDSIPYPTPTITSQTLYRWLSDSIPYPTPTMTAQTLYRWLSDSIPYPTPTMTSHTHCLGDWWLDTLPNTHNDLTNTIYVTEWLDRLPNTQNDLTNTVYVTGDSIHYPTPTLISHTRYRWLVTRYITQHQHWSHIHCIGDWWLDTLPNTNNDLTHTV